VKYIVKNIIIRLIFTGLIALIPLEGLFAQKPTRVKIIDADHLKFDKRMGENIQRLIGHVILQHDSMYLYCDSAHVNEATNSFKGFGNVRIKSSDTLNIYSDLINYDGNTKIAELHHTVRLIDPSSILTTEHLWYDRENKLAYYTTGGKIVDSTNTLTSTRGYYYTELQEAYFKESVILVNPDYIMLTDTMLYQTETEISTFLGPTTITSEENMIYCENGWYDTQNNKSQFNKNAYFLTEEQKLEGDSLYYDRNLDFGKAYNNVIMSDSVQNMIITGNYGEFKRRNGYSYITDSATAVMIDSRDSLFLHSDTLWVYFDSAQNIEFLYAYYHAKFFRRDMQGQCDSLVYKFADSTIFLYNDPVLWSKENQLTADSIRIAMANNQVDTLALINSAFIISMDDTISRNTFNQIKGKTMVSYFRNNRMVKVKIYGNAESIFYVREDDGGLMGINKTSSSDMNIYLSDNEIQGIVPIKNVDSHMYPDAEFQEEERKLKNFKWIEGSRPQNKQDIYKK
jgi:lipopolysaccharide export system protein LptA